MDLKAHKLAKTARALLVAEYTELGIEPQAAQLMAQGHQPGGVHYAAVKALIAALTPPEGYVLVPVEPTARMVSDGHYSIPAEADTPADDWDVPVKVWAAMIAARPEVP